jgi:HlyD family secretion protein
VVARALQLGEARAREAKTPMSRSDEQVRTGIRKAGAPAQLVPLPSASVPGRRRLGKRWLIGGIIALIILASSVASWWALRARGVVHYATAAVTRGAISHTVTATGTVNPVLTIIVGTYVSGVIQELYCDYNTKVKKGQICAKIDPRPYQMLVDQDQANLAAAKAQLEKDKANLAYAKLSYERNVWLVEHNFVSEDTRDNAKSLYSQARAQVELDKATIEQRRAELDAARVNLGYTDIISPVDGTVVSRNVTMGQTVAASFQTPTLFLIATDLTKMQVDTNVSEADIGGIKEGNPATFTVDAFPKRTFDGVVSQVRQSPQTVQNVVTFDAVVSVDNHDLALKPGMTAATRIVTDRRTDVLRVPNQAIRYAPGGVPKAAVSTSLTQGEAPANSHPNEIWVLREGRPVRLRAVFGLEDESFTEVVKADLKVGDQVIINEQQESSGSQSGLPLPRF